MSPHDRANVDDLGGEYMRTGYVEWMKRQTRPPKPHLSDELMKAAINAIDYELWYAAGFWLAMSDYHRTYPPEGASRAATKEQTVEEGAD